MAKTANLKSKSKSIHSRAARRAAPPSNEIDKSLTTVPRTEAAIPKLLPVLGSHANAGVSKKKAKSKHTTRSQRLRQQKGIEKAEAVLDQLEKKLVKSVGKARKVKARKANWDELNRKSDKILENHQETEGRNADDSMVDDQPALSAMSEKVLPVFTSVPAVRSNQAPDEVERGDEDDEIT